jgi:hypothetical protein
MKTHPAFPPVGSSRGAPMGRPNTYPDARPTRYNIKRARVTDQDYDAGGAYWGGLHHRPLFCAWSYDPDPTGFFLYFRANNRKDAAQVAAALISARYP